MVKVSSINIYVLRLDNQKYYVCASGESEEQIRQNFSEKYKHIDVLHAIKNVPEFDEDEYILGYTLDYMEKYGIDNVRGGPYHQLELNLDQMMEIVRKIRCTSVEHRQNLREELKQELREELKQELRLELVEKLNVKHLDQSIKYENINEVASNDKLLFEKLRHWRTLASKNEGIERYKILTDQVLRDIVYYKPKVDLDLLKIKGIGAVKSTKYSETILQLVNDTSNGF